jgi:hypothetical protein
MSDLEKRFKIEPLDSQSIETEEILNELTVLLSGLAGESAQGRNFSADDVSEILEHHATKEFAGTNMGQTLLLLGEALQDAQHSMSRSITDAIQLLLKKELSEMQRSIFRQILREPKLFDWIRTTSA